MGIERGLTMMIGNIQITELYCDRCGYYLGRKVFVGCKAEPCEADDEWEFCPKCGTPLF